MFGFRDPRRRAERTETGPRSARPARGRLRPIPEELEGRALLSRGVAGLAASGGHHGAIVGHLDPDGFGAGFGRDATSNAAFVGELYRRLLHHEPDPQGLRFWTRQLDAGRNRFMVATLFLTSRDYSTSHRDASSYIASLYRDVLGQAPDPRGLAAWTAALNRGAAGRARAAWVFVHMPGSFVRSSFQGGGSGGGGGIGGVQGQGTVSGVTQPGYGSAFICSATKVCAAVPFNRGDGTIVMTINVTGPGTYYLDESNPPTGYVLNNSGRTWNGYLLQVDPSSTSKPVSVRSQDVSGKLPTVTASGALGVRFSGGTVPVGSGVADYFQPLTTIQVAQAGTIIIRQTPIPVT